MRFWVDRDTGEARPSVTTVLKMAEGPGLSRWRDTVPDADGIAAEAAEIGTCIHEAARWWLVRDGRLREATELPKPDVARFAPEVQQRIAVALNAFITWVRGNVAEVYACERVVINEMLGYIGEFDLFLKLKDQTKALSDIKSGNHVSVTAGMQLAAYRYAIEQMRPGVVINQNITIHLPPFATEADIKPHDYQTNLRRFACAKELYNLYESEFKRGADLKPYTKADMLWQIDLPAAAPSVTPDLNVAVPIVTGVAQAMTPESMAPAQRIGM